MIPVPASEPLRTEFAVSVDVVMLTVRGGRLQTLLVTRGIDPFFGRLALPGGFVDVGEDLPSAAVRKLRDETGIDRRHSHLEQLGTFGDPGRDPRGRVVSTAYLAVVPQALDSVAGRDTKHAGWLDVEPLIARPSAGGRDGLAFDHREILMLGVSRLRSKLEYTALAATFCAEEFTVADLRQVYEAVWGQKLDPRNFHRKIVRATGLLEPTGAVRDEGPGRPAALFRLADAALVTGDDLAGSVTILNPPMLRPAP